jgi:hypothetical protein
MSAELAQAVEKDATVAKDAKTGIAETEVEVNGVKIHCISRAIDDLRSVEVRLTRK